MKRVLILLLSAVLMTAALTGCSSGEEDALVSKTPFPEFSEVDIAGDEISSDIFADYDATIVNFWNNGCGSCIAEMPELEELYQDFKERNINLIGVGTDSGESREHLDTAREILKEKGVTYHNISPDPEGDFYKDFVADISTYPTTYIVDSEGNFLRSVSDDAAVTRYGLLADVLTQRDGEDATAEARDILAENGVERTASVSCLGHTKLITGNTVWIHEPYTGLANTCWIDADKHVWQNGVYATSLTLNFKNEMRESESGSEADE